MDLYGDLLAGEIAQGSCSVDELGVSGGVSGRVNQQGQAYIERNDIVL